MKSQHLLFLAAMLLGVVVLAGCDKTVTVTWVNTAMEPRTVDLQGPDIGHEQFVVAGNGGRVPVKVMVPKKELPATYQWSTGACCGNITITDKSPGKLMVDVNTNCPAAQPESKGGILQKFRKRPAAPTAAPGEPTE